jgi:hypothetical protein
MKKGTNDISRISPEHHPDHAREDMNPPKTDKPVSKYFFISDSFLLPEKIGSVNNINSCKNKNYRNKHA